MAHQTDVGLKTLGETLDAVADERPHVRAVVFPDSTTTYAELRAAVDGVARGLIALGVRPGDTVGLWLPNCVEWIVANFAAAAIGAISVPINMRYRVEEVGYILSQADLHTLIMTDRVQSTGYLAILGEVCPEVRTQPVDALHSPALPKLRNVLCIAPTDLPAVRPYQESIRLGQSVAATQLEERKAAVAVADVAHIQYTSGTTAHPKGAMLTHVNLLRDSYEICQAMRITGRDSIYSALPLFHVAGYVAALLAAIHNGGTFVTAAHFVAEESLRLIQQERCTIIRGVETMLIMMLNHPRFGEYDVSSLRGGVVGSTSVEVLRDVHDRMGIRELTSVFGLSETASACTMTRVDDPLEARLATQGRPLPGVEVRIVDPETGETVPQDTAGEILIRGWNVMRGYYHKPEETRAVLDEAGWLHTGDLGLVQDDGNLRFIDRLKDVVRVGGENVSAAEVEALLYRHPKVFMVQIVAAPDPRLGEVCVAFVRTRAGVEATADEIIDFCRDKIASFKVPRAVFFVDDFPMTGSGKVQKFRLRALARELI